MSFASFEAPICKLNVCVWLGYYDHWPPVAMNVAVNEIPVEPSAAAAQSLEANKPNLLRRALVAKKDFAAGELIYMARHQFLCFIS